MRRPEMTAVEFNQLHGIGTAFRYYPIAGVKEFIETKTRSECWELGDGHPVVLVEGKSGGISIFHLVKID